METVITRTGTYLEGAKKLQDQWKSILLLFELRKLVQERKPGNKDPRLTLVRTFLDLTRSRLCRDSRDRIYGILGIFNNTNIVPDYTLAPRQVYQDFVAKHLEAGDFSILHECCIGNPNADEQSYVPFFGQSRSQKKYVPFADPLGATYSAGLHLPPSVDMSNDKYISLQGFFIDTVQQKLDFSEDADPTLDNGATHDSSSSSGEQPLTKLPLRATWGTIYQRIMTQLITSAPETARWQKDYDENRLSPHYTRPPYTHTPLFSVLVHAIRTDLDNHFDWVSTKGSIRTDAHLHRSRRELLLERSLFWTTKGYIGLGTCHLRAGDEVVVFGGDSTPFLLRRGGVRSDGTGEMQNENEPKNEKGTEKDTESEERKIVSDCFLLGSMYAPFPDKCVAGDPSRRKSLISKLRKGEKSERKHVDLRAFVIT